MYNTHAAPSDPEPDPVLCRGLPEESHLQTDTKFPVEADTEVSVKCEEGFTITSGDREITCVEGEIFTSPWKLPGCLIGKFCK